MLVFGVIHIETINDAVEAERANQDDGEAGREAERNEENGETRSKVDTAANGKRGDRGVAGRGGCGMGPVSISTKRTSLRAQEEALHVPGARD